jgi:hypothetical protein
LADVILVYGPAALLVICIYVLEGRFRRNFFARNQSLRKISGHLYYANGVWIIVLGIFICALFVYRIIYGDNLVIRGIFESVDSGHNMELGLQDIQSDRYSYRDNSALDEFHWLIYSDHTLGEEGYVIFTLSVCPATLRVRRIG